ncbi:MAG: PQQ-dependent sugar dehydrogenase [Chloroflexota bacterium]|jgi:glucose/arabinose dehydrogenase
MTGTLRPRRHRRPLVVALLALVAIAVSALSPAGVAAAFGITLSPVASGLASPTQITNAHDGTNRLFVVEQRGTIRVIQNGVLQPGYFLDIRSKVEDGGERGLLGLAFHPQFASNHYLYVFYTRNGGDVVVSRFKTNAARTDAVESTAHPLLLIEHSAQSNHNGGALAFSPVDHYLYVGVGDGGGSGDAHNNAQRKSTLLGKVLRINVNGTGHGPFDHYSVPKSNPFYGSKPGLEAIWAYGLRNPWRISFDRGTGKLFIADVGQGRYEEVDRERVGIAGGRNYGWNAMEGMHCYTSSKCPLAGDTLPNAEYSHDGGNCAITGGYVYRGPTQTALRGLYVFADWCSGRIWTIPFDGPAVNQPETLRADTALNITSFGESENGELYAVTGAGGVYRVLAS